MHQFLRRRSALLLAVATACAGCAFPGDAPTRPDPQHTVPDPRPAAKYPAAKAVPLDPGLFARATDEVRSAVGDADDEVRRGQGIEAVRLGRLGDAARYLVPALDDTSPFVRKAAALAAGELKARAALPRLQALADPATAANRPGYGAVGMYVEQERLAVVFALHRMGDTRYSHELVDAADDARPQVRRDVAFCLGRIGNPTAIPVLKPMLKRDRDPNVRLEAAEGLWRLGDPDGFDALVSATVSRYSSDRMIALLALAAPRDPQVIGHIAGQLTDDYPEVALVAARAAGELGYDMGYGVARAAVTDAEPRRRGLAAFAFGAIGRADAQPFLAKLVADPVPYVRLAAAAAVLQLNAKAAER